ncbi:ADP-ribosylation factor-like protein 2 [Talaromyces islandicus]|uniref:ADP-ribosylation factor-like protein 2 n=1 Tax=Talaromyces islandicus TaxID=28573 RepID=A0A0U1M147_TALIS|nr:ADP-ribosylation factor-like protein 2 [Talaromyces islandicus]
MLSILRKARLKDKEMRILMLGLDNAGKTTIVKQIMHEDVTTVSPTLGFIIKTIDFQGYKLNIWDVGGQKTLRSYWRNYFEKTDALIWVVDATDRLRIEDCRDELAGLLLEEASFPPASTVKRKRDGERDEQQLTGEMKQSASSRSYSTGVLE